MIWSCNPELQNVAKYQSHKIYHRSHEKLQSGIDSKRKKFSRGENQERHLPGRCAFSITSYNSNQATLSHT